MKVNQNYLNLIERKAEAVGRLVYMQNSHAQPIIGLCLSSLERIEKELELFERDANLERIVSKAKIIIDKIIPAENKMNGTDTCPYCEKYTSLIFDVPDCSVTRLKKGVKKSCEEFTEDKKADKIGEIRDAKMDYDVYINFLRLIDEGILDNYKGKTD